jgi:hypothetical protein
LPQARPPGLPDGPVSIDKPQVTTLIRAPLRNRTVDLLLTINPPADAVATCNNAAQVRDGPRCCCRPTYLVITPGPGGPDARPLAGCPGCSLPDRRSRRPAAAARAGRDGRPQAPAAGQDPAPGQGRPAAAAWLTYLPTVSPAGQRSLHGQYRGTQPSELPHTASTAPLPPDPAPAGHQTRPRHPARPTQGRPDLPK